MRSGKGIAAGLICLSAFAGVFFLLVPSSSSWLPDRPSDPIALATPATVAEPDAIAVSSEAPISTASRAALESIARKLCARALTDAARLERDLIAAQTSSDKAGVRVALERTLRERPELAPAAIRAFDRAEDRETLFVISRGLVECLDRADVREALERSAAGGTAARRECALIALPADERSLALARRGLDDVSAAPTVRAAGAYALARGLDRLSSADREAVLGVARGLASAPAEDAHLRAEALHLLARAPAPQDGALARAVIAEPGARAELALAAAHVGLAGGSMTERDVAAALAANPDSVCRIAASTLSTPRSGP